jgi:hypothetical protein
MYCKKYNFFLQTLKYQPIIHTNYQGNTDRLVEDLNSVLCEAADAAMLKKSSKVN